VVRCQWSVGSGRSAVGGRQLSVGEGRQFISVTFWCVRDQRSGGSWTRHMAMAAQIANQAVVRQTPN
jgi:hypothetical protein